MVVVGRDDEAARCAVAVEPARAARMVDGRGHDDRARRRGRVRPRRDRHARARAADTGDHPGTRGRRAVAARRRRDRDERRVQVQRRTGRRAPRDCIRPGRTRRSPVGRRTRCTSPAPRRRSSPGSARPSSSASHPTSGPPGPAPSPGCWTPTCPRRSSRRRTRPCSPVATTPWPPSATCETFGATREQLAEVAVAAREWALLNPRAFRHGAGPLTIEQVLDAPAVSSPLGVLDCCLVTDGGGAVVLTTLQRARDLPRPPVVLLGYGESDHQHLDDRDTTTC